MDEPKSLPEWKAYTAALDGERLVDEARSANTASFVRTLKEEGYKPEEIHTILILFARRFRATGLRPPGDGFYDYFELMETDPPVRV